MTYISMFRVEQESDPNFIAAKEIGAKEHQVVNLSLCHTHPNEESVILTSIASEFLL